MARVVHGDCTELLPMMPEGCVDAVVTDPPYGLVEPRSGASDFRPRTDSQKAARRGGFMGKKWDAEVPGAAVWAAVLRVLRPGGYMLCMGGSRTYHRLACAVEDAGFEVRDCLMWLYGTGFPKGKSCLKPAYEPILLCRKPGRQVLPLGIEACRVGCGRWPANVCHDGSDEIMDAFAEQSKAMGVHGAGHSGYRKARGKYRPSSYHITGAELFRYGDGGTAARFFYCAKASKAERDGNPHPTVKPLALMRWLVRLVAEPGGLVLDPFAGSGSTGVACVQEGRRFVGIEREAEYLAIAERRLAEATAG